MASQTFFDLNAMVVELEQLEHTEREVSEYRRKLHDKLDSFPNDVIAARERDVSNERRRLHRRIDVLRSELRLLNRDSD
jgi:hypothetical protein